MVGARWRSSAIVPVLAGLAAAIVPACRTSRLNVLDARQHE
jgi:hypothetical protein